MGVVGLKLIIAGSRTFCCSELHHDSKPDPNCVRCLELARKIWRVLTLYTELLEFRMRPVEVVSGRARGADKLGELFADRMKFLVKQFPAKWRVGEKVNMAAGFERNEEMKNYADAALIMWDGKSKGSLDMAKRMKKAGKPCVVYNFVTGRIE
jgi:hypothetical protein